MHRKNWKQYRVCLGKARKRIGWRTALASDPMSDFVKQDMGSPDRGAFGRGPLPRPPRSGRVYRAWSLSKGTEGSSTGLIRRWLRIRVSPARYCHRIIRSCSTTLRIATRNSVRACNRTGKRHRCFLRPLSFHRRRLTRSCLRLRSPPTPAMLLLITFSARCFFPKDRSMREWSIGRGPSNWLRTCRWSMPIWERHC